MVACILTALAAYLLGSVPTGYLVARARGIDIRTVGSGNIGATNVFRYLGKPAGICVLLADALKGWLAVVVLVRGLRALLHWNFDSQTQEWLAICAGLFAVLGHNYTCWLHFKGGKGIATSAGVLVALVHSALFIILGLWIVVFALTRYVSLASICASAALPVAAWLTGESTTMIIVTSVLAMSGIYKHKPNIQRLPKGTQTPFRSKAPQSPPHHAPRPAPPA